MSWMKTRLGDFIDRYWLGTVTIVVIVICIAVFVLGKGKS